MCNVSRILHSVVKHMLCLFTTCSDDPRNHVFFKNINFHRLEAGLVEAPWVPKSNVVYANNMDRFRDTSGDENITFDAKDEKLFKEFSTGAVSIKWQKEMIDSGVFDELNDSSQNGFENTWTSKLCAIL